MSSGISLHSIQFRAYARMQKETLMLQVAEPMDSNSFLAGLMRTPVGREVINEEAKASRGKLQEAARDIIAANAVADDEIAEVDDEIKRATAKIETVSAALVEAQEVRGALIRRRAEIGQRRLDAVRPLTAMLRAAAPVQLIDFRSELKWLRHAAAFRSGVGEPVVGIGRDARAQDDQRLQIEADSAELRTFLKRSSKVHAAAEALMFQPEIDFETRIGGLRRELAVPDSLAKGWKEVGEGFIALGRVT